MYCASYDLSGMSDADKTKRYSGSQEVRFRLGAAPRNILQ